MRNSFELFHIAMREIEGSSDRSAVIVGGAIIDEVLRDILENFLLSSVGSTKGFFSGSGPLATFSAKISMAYFLGLISKWEKDRIDTIRRIRNDFAHGFDTASFSNKTTSDRCLSLKVPSEMIMPRYFPVSIDGVAGKCSSIREADIKDPRSVFQECIFVLINCLAARSCLALKNRRTEAKDFSAAHESMEVQMEALTSLQEKYKELSAKYEKLSGECEEPVTDQSKEDRIIELYRMMIGQTKDIHGIRN